MSRSSWGFVCFVVAIALGVMVVYPAIKNVHSISVNRDAWQSAVTTKQNRETQLKTLATTFAGYSGQIGSLLTTLPTSPQIPELLVTIEGLVNASSVSMTAISPQDDASSKKVTISISGLGSMSQVETLIQNINEAIFHR